MIEDLHIVIEARQTNDGTFAYRAVTPAVTWQVAQDTWNRLDFGISSVSEMRYFMVRSANDPRWSFLIRPTPRPERHPNGKLYADKGLLRAAKDYAKSTGYAGREGGWIYRNGNPICQGWETFARQFRSHIRSTTMADGRTASFALTEPFMGEPVEVTV